MAVLRDVSSPSYTREAGTMELLRDLMRQIALYIGDVSRLFMVELNEKKSFAKTMIFGFATAAFLGVFAFLFLSLALVAGIAYWLGWGWALLIVGVAYAIIAAAVAVPAMSYLKGGEMRFDRTITRVRQDSEWLKHKIAA
jgi:uncharacterized membrane protein YqjE